MAYRLNTVLCRDLGMIDYAECWNLQRTVFDRLTAAKAPGRKIGDDEKQFERPEDGDASGTDTINGSVGTSDLWGQYLLLCEHPAVYTLGKSGDEGNLLFDEEFLTNKGASFYRIDRGGDITFHGPGQLVGYPILDLDTAGLGLRDYIHLLEQAVIDTVDEYGIKGTRVEGAAGVWLADDKPLRKICAIGVRSSRYVTMHGFALNANTDLRWFDYINPCGFADRGVTSIEKETGNKVDMTELKSRFTAHLERNLNIKIKIEDYANRKTLGNQATGGQTAGGRIGLCCGDTGSACEPTDSKRHIDTE